MLLSFVCLFPFPLFPSYLRYGFIDIVCLFQKMHFQFLGMHTGHCGTQAMCLEASLSNDHTGMKDSKPLSFPAGRLWQDGSGLLLVLLLGLGDCEEPRWR